MMFDVLREMNAKDAADTGAGPDVIKTTAAMIDIIEELDRKLERIATAVELLTAALYTSDGRAAFGTRSLD